MKNKMLLTLALVAGLTFSSMAQISATYSFLSPASSGSHVTDTVTNTGTIILSSPIVKGSPNSTTVLATFTKLTGTVAGTATLLGSIDGTNWTSASSTSYTVTDVATQSTSWIITGSPFLYFRLSVTGSGTSTYTGRAQALTRNPK